MTKVILSEEQKVLFNDFIEEISIYYTFYDIYQYKEKYYGLCGSGCGFELIPFIFESKKELKTFWDNGNSTWDEILNGFKEMIDLNKKDNLEEYHKNNCDCCCH